MICYAPCRDGTGVSLAGANMTLLPLVLAGDRFGLSPAEVRRPRPRRRRRRPRARTRPRRALRHGAPRAAPPQVGGCFAMQSAISVLGAAPAAALADRVGPRTVIAPALCVSASAMMAFPLAADLPQALAVLCVWAARQWVSTSGAPAAHAARERASPTPPATGPRPRACAAFHDSTQAGGTILGSAPTAHATNLVPSATRAQALALMRTVGDLGLFVGATAVGGAATVWGSDHAMQATAAFLFASSGSFLVRTRLVPGSPSVQVGSKAL